VTEPTTIFHSRSGAHRGSSVSAGGQAVGLLDEVAEGALQLQGFGGEGAGMG
jgi:hypothetical protein